LLDAYYDAFSKFLRDGTPDVLADYCEDKAELAYLHVYRNGFLKTCTDVLRSNFSSVHQLVGEACFTAVAHRYVQANPPRAASLATYGDDFAQLIEATRDLHGLAYLACIATLDRAWTELYFAEDAEMPDAGALAGMSAETIMKLRCRLAPSARLVSLNFSALEAWAHLRRGALRTQMEIRRSPLKILMWRWHGDILFRALGVAEHAFIARLTAGQACAEAALAATELDATFDVAAGFASLLRDRMLIFET
jgi:hypothetical protein